MYFTHGKIEASICLPKTANGLWPAFWMMGNDFSKVGWPQCGEIDIMEFGNANGIKAGTQDRYFNGACHWGFYKDVGGGNWAYPNYANAITNAYSVQDGDFHLFTCYWDEENITMYLDQDRYPNAEPYFKMGIKKEANPDDWSTGEYFHKPCFILFNMAVGGHFTGIYDINQITALAGGEASMYVDFVKVYQQGNTSDTFVGPQRSAVTNTNANNLSVYPTIVTDYFNVQGDNLQEVSVFAMNGVKLLTTTQSQVNISTLPQGLYLVRLSAKNSTTEYIRILKH